MFWEDKIREAMLAEGISKEVADKLINGVIEDVISDVRWEAEADGAYREEMSHECCEDHG